MVEDGLNDAAALAVADAGCAIGAGTDLTHEVCDIGLIASDPALLLDALDLSALAGSQSRPAEPGFCLFLQCRCDSPCRRGSPQSSARNSCDVRKQPLGHGQCAARIEEGGSNEIVRLFFAPACEPGRPHAREAGVKEALLPMSHRRMGRRRCPDCFRDHPFRHTAPEGGHPFVPDGIPPVRAAPLGVAGGRIDSAFIDIEHEPPFCRYAEHAEGYGNEAILCPGLQNYVGYGARRMVEDNILDSPQRLSLGVDKQSTLSGTPRREPLPGRVPRGARPSYLLRPRLAVLRCQGRETERTGGARSRPPKRPRKPSSHPVRERQGRYTVSKEKTRYGKDSLSIADHRAGEGPGKGCVRFLPISSHRGCLRASAGPGIAARLRLREAPQGSFPARPRG